MRATRTKQRRFYDQMSTFVDISYSPASSYKLGNLIGYKGLFYLSLKVQSLFSEASNRVN